MRDVPALCGHEGVAMLVVSQCQMAVNCANCNEVRFYDATSGDKTTVLKEPTFRPKHMCYGEPKRIFIYNEATKNTGSVDELKASKTAFTPLNKSVKSGIRPFQSMCYIPAPHRLLVFSGLAQNTIQAVSVESDTVRWELGGMVDGAVCQPHDLVYSLRHGCLFVADGYNCRILILSPGDGAHVQTIQLPLGGDYVINLSILESQLLVHHVATTGEEKVSYFSIN